MTKGFIDRLLFDAIETLVIMEFDDGLVGSIEDFVFYPIERPLGQIFDGVFAQARFQEEINA